ncbi:hypothetical protein [Wolbachia endosymbiont of Pentidionis agamae]|uniref:hypothetical protein n=1 Tax=Wolbachia endosymbiont of Pentidionis agamae TaxID=3110435 RepID=UPI002FD4DCB1
MIIVSFFYTVYIINFSEKFEDAIDRLLKNLPSFAKICDRGVHNAHYTTQEITRECGEINKLWHNNLNHAAPIRDQLMKDGYAGDKSREFLENKALSYIFEIIDSMDQFVQKYEIPKEDQFQHAQLKEKTFVNYNEDLDSKYEQQDSLI